MGLESSGVRVQRAIRYDEEFLITTLPTTPKGAAKVVPGRGMKVNQIHYWSDRFRNPAVEGIRVPVRYDPFDVGMAYAFVEQQWVPCYSEYHATLQGRSEKEIRLASHELRRRNQISIERKGVTAKRLADFLQSVESEEALLEQRMRDREGQSARRRSVGVVPDLAVYANAEVPTPRTGANPTLTPTVQDLYGEF